MYLYKFTEFPGPVRWLKNLGWEDTFRQIHDRCDPQKKRASWRVWTTFSYMGRSHNYGRNSNILIPDPYHYDTNGLNFMHRKWYTGNQYMVKSAENRMRSNLELLPVINVKSRPRYISALKKSSQIYLGPKKLDTILMHWMSVKLADTFQIGEHSWPCLFQ
jgi:hypothetical protein